MDPAAGLSLRHTLYPVYAAFVFQLGICALAGDHEFHFLHAADAALADVDQLHLPPLALCVMDVHPVQLGSEQGRLVSACACADLHDYVLIIVGVLGKQKDLKLLLQLLDPFFRVGKLFLGHLPHFLVALFLQKGQAVLHVLLCLLIFLICLHQRRQIRLFLHQLPESFLILCHGRIV